MIRFLVVLVVCSIIFSPDIGHSKSEGQMPYDIAIAESKKTGKKLVTVPKEKIKWMKGGFPDHVPKGYGGVALGKLFTREMKFKGKCSFMFPSEGFVSFARSEEFDAGNMRVKGFGARGINCDFDAEAEPRTKVLSETNEQIFHSQLVAWTEGPEKTAKAMFTVGIKKDGAATSPGVFVLGRKNSCSLICYSAGEKNNAYDAFLFLYEMQKHIKVLN